MTFPAQRGKGTKKMPKNVQPLSKVNKIDFFFKSDDIFGISASESAKKNCGQKNFEEAFENGVISTAPAVWLP